MPNIVNSPAWQSYKNETKYFLVFEPVPVPGLEGLEWSTNRKWYRLSELPDNITQGLPNFMGVNELWVQSDSGQDFVLTEGVILPTDFSAYRERERERLRTAKEKADKMVRAATAILGAGTPLSEEEIIRQQEEAIVKQFEPDYLAAADDRDREIIRLKVKLAVLETRIDRLKKENSLLRVKSPNPRSGATLKKRTGRTSKRYIRIDGVGFDSVHRAAEAIGVPYDTLYNRIRLKDWIFQANGKIHVIQEYF